MSKLQLVLFFTSILGVVSCQKENMGDCFKSTGSIVEESRLISNFSTIKLHDRINLFIRFDSTLGLVVKGGKNLQEHIETSIKNNTLTIQNNNRCNWVRSFKKEVDIYLTIPDLRSLEYYGSGEVRFLNTLKTDFFALNMFQASGNIYLKLQTPHAELKSHTGPGTITASGNVTDLVTFLGGYGFVDATAITSKTGLAVTTNTGYIRINSTDFLKADISGPGNIEYFGNPSIELIDNGKGELIHR